MKNEISFVTTSNQFSLELQSGEGRPRFSWTRRGGWIFRVSALPGEEIRATASSSQNSCLVPTAIDGEEAERSSRRRRFSPVDHAWKQYIVGGLQLEDTHTQDRRDDAHAERV